ncbi:M15 family metallopeptidase [Sinorhizobium sp. BG8]|uniref:M15 family metallopeptidase n=1 Tax=Sinorhizobium sp. BG8 TaxID=2613773 RepID=UPI00193E0D0E|nr:M15 family metallopeptidase [Sinorhizobium sp. BG8]QRM55331.1 M15 family metallopeptidase [Sinorhizobium sp. BG8]
MTEPVSDRERWEEERERAQREHKLKERELSLKELDADRTRRVAGWTNPIVLAIATAALAATGNALVTYVSARQQRALEESKAEAARILEMIKTDDTEKAKANLAFLVEAGLISSTDVREKISNFIATRGADELPSLPAATSFQRPLSQSERDDLLGQPTVKSSSDPNDRVSIDDPWYQANLVEIEIPQLLKIQNPAKSARIKFHKTAALSLQEAFEEIEASGFLSDIVTFDGAFRPRVLVGSINRLSAHALGIAIDLNAKSNPFQKPPPELGQEGSLFRVAPIFEKHGFSWGGREGGVQDPMHFEFADRTKLVEAQ